MLKEKENTWVQCQWCGHIYQIDDNIPIDRSIINSVCPKCRYEYALNCGNHEDIYYYYNANLDNRYY